jgi:hypothetical protein
MESYRVLGIDYGVSSVEFATQLDISTRDVWGLNTYVSYLKHS